MKDLGLILAAALLLTIMFPKEAGKILAKIEKGYQIELNEENQ